MTGGRKAVSIGLVALIVAGLGTSPALFAREQRSPRVLKRIAVDAMPLAGLGSFTPASADPRLAAVLSRTGLNATGFQFTPSEGSVIGNRAVKVAVRARTLRPTAMPDRVAAAAVAPAPALNPVAYNLGVSVGWKRFALSGDLARLDLAGQPGSREQMGLGIAYGGRKLSARVGASSDRPLADQPRMIADAPGYSLDMGGSYKLTRNLDVTAGVRYRSERERMLRVEPERRESQAVYVGTAFRF